jgi:hypothetical protein
VLISFPWSGSIFPYNASPGSISAITPRFRFFWVGLTGQNHKYPSAKPFRLGPQNQSDCSFKDILSMKNDRKNLTLKVCDLQNSSR